MLTFFSTVQLYVLLHFLITSPFGTGSISMFSNITDLSVRMYGNWLVSVSNQFPLKITDLKPVIIILKTNMTWKPEEEETKWVVTK